MSADTLRKACECGCGEPAPIARDTDRRPGQVAGEPIRFVKGHNVRLRDRSDTEARFWAKVQKTDGCWLWLGSRRRAYGRLHAGRQSVAAHRYSYELCVGPIPDSLTIDHLCRNTLCVNPEHMEPVTVAENTSRARRDLAACVHGHEFTEENTYRPPGDPSRRICRTCQKERKR